MPTKIPPTPRVDDPGYWRFRTANTRQLAEGKHSPIGGREYGRDVQDGVGKNCRSLRHGRTTSRGAPTKARLRARRLVRRRHQRLLQLLEQPLVRGGVAEPLLATAD